MNKEKVKSGEWIRVGKINAYVISVISDDEVSAGYLQNDIKAIKESFVWDGQRWQFKDSGPSGSYLSGSLEAIVKNGPFN